MIFTKRFWPSALLLLAAGFPGTAEALDISVVSLSAYNLEDAREPVPNVTLPPTPLPHDPQNRTDRPQVEIRSLLIGASGELSWGPDRYVSGGENQNIGKYLLGPKAVAELKLRGDNPVHDSPRLLWLTAIVHPDSAAPDRSDSTPRIALAFPGRISPGDLPAVAYLEEHGYTVWVDGWIDENGSLVKIHITPKSLDALGQVVAENLARWRFAPARREGRPIQAPLRFPLVFVPRASDANTTETFASLELLPTDPAKPQPEFLDWRPITVPFAFERSTVYKAAIDAGGSVIALTAETKSGEPWESFLKTALRSWQFGPAIREGRPVVSEIRFSLRSIPADTLQRHASAIPVILTKPAYPNRLVATVEVLNTKQIWIGGRGRGSSYRGASTLGPSSSASQRAPGPTIKGAGDIPPRTILQTYRLHAGSAELSYIIDAQGFVRNLRVLRSRGQPFEIAAAHALVQRRYFPARDARGTAVPVRTRETFSFAADSDVHEALYYPLANDPRNAAFPAPPKLTKLAQPLYPYEAWANNEDGEAVAEFIVGRDGRTSQIRILSSTREYFGESLRAALDACEFSPTTTDGQPAEVVLRRQETFRMPRRSPPMLKPGQTPSLVIAPPPHAVIRNAEVYEALDVSPKLILGSLPEFPTALLESAPELSRGEASLELFIDRDGLVGHGRVISATRPAFGYAALQASVGWVFSPAVKNGERVACSLRMPVSFALPESN